MSSECVDFASMYEETCDPVWLFLLANEADKFGESDTVEEACQKGIEHAGSVYCSHFYYLLYKNYNDHDPDVKQHYRYNALRLGNLFVRSEVDCKLSLGEKKN